jgi:hypothetical protein
MCEDRSNLYTKISVPELAISSTTSHCSKHVRVYLYNLLYGLRSYVQKENKIGMKARY